MTVVDFIVINLAKHQLGNFVYMIKNKTVARIFDDLDAYRAFCVEYGYVFNEGDLYKRNSPYSQCEKVKRGDRVPNNWRPESLPLAQRRL